MSKIGLIYHPIYLLHETGEHPEKKERLTAILNKIKSEELDCDLITPEPASVEQIAAVQWMVPHLASRMFREWNVWGLQWWLLIAALIAAPKRLLRPAQLFVLLEILGAIAALVVAGLIAPAELQDHIGGSSHRYLLQLSPLAVLFAAGQWGGEVGEPTADNGTNGMTASRKQSMGKVSA